MKLTMKNCKCNKSYVDIIDGIECCPECGTDYKEYQTIEQLTKSIRLKAFKDVIEAIHQFTNYPDLHIDSLCKIIPDFKQATKGG